MFIVIHSTLSSDFVFNVTNVNDNSMFRNKYIPRLLIDILIMFFQQFSGVNAYSYLH